MHERLKDWMKKEDLRSSELADVIGVNRSTVSHILSGRNKPSIDFLEKLLLNYPTINANWLIGGVGNIRITESNQEISINKEIDKIVVFYDNNSFDELKT